MLDMTSPMHICGDLRVRYGQMTDAGAKPENEDCLGIQIPEDDLTATKGLAVVIADGVSAAEAGREASEICVQGFLADYFSTPESWQVKTSAHRVLASLNRWLFSEGQRYADEHKGFVSAMSALILKSRTAYVFHVGDTRVYRIRDGEFVPLTEDHQTWISEKTRCLTRAMGISLDLRIDYRSTDVESDDGFFLSTDGVHDYIPRDELKRLVAAGREKPDEACREIVSLALRNGSPDNLSCQLLWIDALPAADASEVYAELARLPFPPALEPGMKLDGFEIEKLLNENSRSQLYLVRDVASDERLVMKTPSVKFADDAAYIERFIMEEWIGRRVESPHLVGVREKARTLRHWIAQNPRPEIGAVTEIIRQVSEGLRALHRRETLHQDLKPDNIMIQPDGNVVIVDFGSTYIAGINEIDVPYERDRKLGTMRYSAPEYRLDQRPTEQSDLFSLAVVAYEMLTAGHHPYGAKFERAQTLRDFSALTYTPTARHNPLAPTWFDSALRKALSMDARQRHRALSEFLTDLKHPNPQFRMPSDAPLLAQDPVFFWQLVAGILFVATLVLFLALVW
jgi:serine/threonine protein phosphatase PrpC